MLILDDTIEVLLCGSCVQLHANGEVTVDESEPEPLSLIGNHTVSLGRIHDDAMFAEDTGWSECQHEHIDFSTTPCGGCGQHLAGYRAYAMLWPAV